MGLPRRYGVAGALLLILGGAWGAFQVTKLRTFQFFGPLVARVETSLPQVALTFDDGPTEHTPALLQLLAEYRVPATFFLVGEAVARSPEWTQTIRAAGHELGNHSYTHQRMVLKSSAWVADEIEKTDALLRNSGYQGPLHFRPPYGKKGLALPWYLAQTGRTTIMWDIEPETWPEVRDKPEVIVQHVMERVRPGSIILLHPMGKYPATRQALPLLIAQLQHRGYQLVTVSELLKAQGK